MTRITVACLDMAGTTVRRRHGDRGVHLGHRGAEPRARAFDQAMKDVRPSMGQSKIEVFRRILGDERAAQETNEAFEDHYAAAVRRRVAACRARRSVQALRDARVWVCLATGFSPATRDAIISGWAGGG